MQGVVSVIIAWCNTEVDLLIQALTSVDRQTYEQIEIVVCNDGSTSEKKDEFLRKSQQFKKEFTLIENDKNEGIPSARNKSVSSSSGDWLVWLDADDTLEENCVSRLFNAANGSHKDMIVGECIVHEKDRTLRRKPKTYFDLAKQYFRTPYDPFLLNVISVQPQIVSRKAFFQIGGFNIEYHLAEMTEFFLRFVVKCGLDRLGFIEDAVYFYNRKQDNSVSANRELLFQYRKRALIYYKQELGIEVDDICYIGRSSNTGMQSYVPIIADKIILPDYLKIMEHQISLGGSNHGTKN